MITEVLPSRNGAKTAVPRGRPFVDAKQRFTGLFATEKAWAYAMAVIALASLAIVALLVAMNLSLQYQLAQRQVVFIGETTAKQLVPLFPNGAGSMVCDATCVEGSLEAWVSAFRFISGEQDSAQIEQHKAQAKAAAFIARGSAAATVVNQYEQRYPSYALAAKGLRLDVSEVHIDADHMQPNRYSAQWVDVVTDARTHRVVGRRKFGAQIDVTVNPAARDEQSVQYDPGGVLIQDLHLWGDN